MSWRRQLPVYSPLSLGALAHGMGAWLGGGGHAREQIEAWISERFGSPQALLTDSGTSALAVAMQVAMRRNPGKPVLLPAYGCYDLVTAAMAPGVMVRWYDIEPGTLQPDWDSLEAATSDDLSAIVAVHHYGVPVDIARLRTLIASTAGRSHGSASGPAPLLIEDAAQAVGGHLDGKPLGALGDFGVLSFGRGKGVTGGGGGALLAMTPETTRILEEIEPTLGPSSGNGRSLVSSGAQWLLARPSLYAVPASLPFLRLGATVFRPPHPAGRMAAAQLGVLAGVLGLVAAENATRAGHAARLAEASGDWAIPITSPGASAGYLRFPLLLPSGLAPLREAPETGQLGIMPGYPIALPDLPESPFPRVEEPGARLLAAQLVTVPVHSLLNDRDLQRIETLLRTWRSSPSGIIRVRQ